MYQRCFKRFFDVVLSGTALLLLSPLFALIALLVRVKLGSPVFFRQERPGKDEKIFLLYKFRTMTDGKDGHGRLLPDEVRLTPFGKFLRSTSLDELPELFNILKGDMSIIGPRPLLVEYLPLYNAAQRQRHNVRPGLSGWAQIHGRNALPWEKRFACDIYYVQHISFWLDIKILFLTVAKVFRREGITQEGQATVQNFQGNLETYKGKECPKL